MAERPILFSGPMVRAILAGTKTQTRRVVKPQPDPPWLAEVTHAVAGPGPFAWPIGALGQQCGAPLPLRYEVGDRLWVRETIRCTATWNDGRDDRASAVYVADDEPVPLDAWPWKRYTLPAIHCPRGLSRITLEITAVRVERLQEISNDDAKAEGCVTTYGDYGAVRQTALEAFAALWDSINAKRAPWASNPWVSALTFSRVPEGASGA